MSMYLARHREELVGDHFFGSEHSFMMLVNQRVRRSMKMVAYGFLDMMS
jgi:hypothetical protein